jgi:hypothetical protein
MRNNIKKMYDNINPVGADVPFADKIIEKSEKTKAVRFYAPIFAGCAVAVAVMSAGMFALGGRSQEADMMAALASGDNLTDIGFFYYVDTSIFDNDIRFPAVTGESMRTDGESVRTDGQPRVDGTPGASCPTELSVIATTSHSAVTTAPSVITTQESTVISPMVTTTVTGATTPAPRTITTVTETTTTSSRVTTTAPMTTNDPAVTTIRLIAVVVECARAYSGTGYANSVEKAIEFMNIRNFGLNVQSITFTGTDSPMGTLQYLFDMVICNGDELVKIEVRVPHTEPL